jgi:hypothetical protein
VRVIERTDEFKLRLYIARISITRCNADQAEMPLKAMLTMNLTPGSRPTDRMPPVEPEIWDLVAVCSRCGDYIVVFRNVPEKLSHITARYETKCRRCGWEGSFAVVRVNPADLGSDSSNKDEQNT